MTSPLSLSLEFFPVLSRSMLSRRKHLPWHLRLFFSLYFAATAFFFFISSSPRFVCARMETLSPVDSRRKERRTDAYECLQYFLQQNRSHFRVKRLRRSTTSQLLYPPRAHRSVVTKLDVSNRQVLQRHTHVEVDNGRYTQCRRFFLSVSC
jgi:hypothetical protein